MTLAQQLALRWLVNRGCTGVFNRNGVLLAAGELAGVTRATWNALCVSGELVIEKRRATVTEMGVAWCNANISQKEAGTVAEDSDA